MLDFPINGDSYTNARLIQVELSEARIYNTRSKDVPICSATPLLLIKSSYQYPLTLGTPSKMDLSIIE